MESFQEADSTNLPKVDGMMLASFFAENARFLSSAEFKNSKTAASWRDRCGDDAVGYVQLYRQSGLCIVKCKVCLEKDLKQHTVSMTINEKTYTIVNVHCDTCSTQSQQVCKHALTLLMWSHRRSEESSTSVESYWKEPQYALLGTNKFIKAKDLSDNTNVVKSDLNIDSNKVLQEFLKEAKRLNIDCPLVRYQPDYELKTEDSLSLHILSLKYNKKLNYDKFLEIIKPMFTEENIKLIEIKTKCRYDTPLWYELQYGRIITSEAFEVCCCEKSNISYLVDIIMDDRSILEDKCRMRKQHNLEEKVRNTAESYMEIKIEKCGLFISHKHPMLAACISGIVSDRSAIIEIKCPTSKQDYEKYVTNGVVTAPSMCELQLQMYIANIKSAYFCVSDPDFESNKEITIFKVIYDNENVKKSIDLLLQFWKTNIYPVLYESTIME